MSGAAILFAIAIVWDPFLHWRYPAFGAFEDDRYERATWYRRQAEKRAGK